MKKPILIVLIGCFVVLAGFCLYPGGKRVLRRDSVWDNMQAGVLQTSGPVSLAAARGQCPIPLPESATNVQYAVWSLWQASQTFVRFEAPPSECLEHARTVMQPHAQGAGASVESMNVTGPLPQPIVLDPKALNVAWFDLPRFTNGIAFGLDTGRGPKVWVETNKGWFYYQENE